MANNDCVQPLTEFVLHYGGPKGGGRLARGGVAVAWPVGRVCRVRWECVCYANKYKCGFNWTQV